MKRYILRRIIPRNECPGTCCKMTGVFPESGTTRCIYFEDNFPGRPHGGCPFFNPDNTINLKTYNQLSVEDQDKFQYACNNWPVPSKIPMMDTPYDRHFGQAFEPVCECFEWEVINNGSGNSTS